MMTALAGWVSSVGGIAALRYAWVRDRRSRPYAIIAGWSLLLMATVLFGRAYGGEIGIPFGIMVISMLALAFVLANMEVRPAKARRERDAVIDPSDRQKKWWRGILRALLAGPVSGAAGIGVGVALAAKLPLETINAVAIGGLVVPLIWGGGMAWTLSDDKVMRAMAVLVSVCLVSYSIAFLF